MGEGPEGVEEPVGAYRTAFPDLRLDIGEMMGVGPTGGRVEVTGVEMNHVGDGRISSSYTVSDAASLTRQLGVL